MQHSVEPAEDIVNLRADRLMLGDHVMGRLVTGLRQDEGNRVTVMFDSGMWLAVEGDDMIPVDKAWR